MQPRYTKEQLWERIVHIGNTKIPSLNGKTWHMIIARDDDKSRYKIQYPRRYTAWVHLEKLYVLYCELYLVGSLTRSYMDTHCNRLLERTTWQVPGAAMLAILPLLDDAIEAGDGFVRLRGH